MTSPIRKNAKKSVALLASALMVTGCVSPVATKSGNYTKPIGGSPVTANPTPYSTSLVCMGDYAHQVGLGQPRIAVGRILDYTGKEDFEGGRRVTQGASLMAISAFAKAGARLVERFDTSVSELELKYANNKLIGDAADQDFRKITAGSIPGSDFYLVGGITELNSNIRSVGIDGFIGDRDVEDPKGNGGAKMFVINVGLDLRLVETESLEVVDVISYQKQIIGREISAGIFDFANNNVFDIGLGERAQEPIQLAVRSVIERAVLEMTANLYGITSPDVCGALANNNIGVPTTNSITGNYVQAYENLATNNGQTREEASRWHDDRDRDIENAKKVTLRGRKNN
ncbi:holdfast anchoring protein HfaB [Hirschia baltica]|uniref:Holdfast attachment protein HfaB n=1 Tax=Hirschia baltica (strain ATCC 49814 / DSM 5838 / IFAM 1418) TaxID=582402 RepID=C6XNU9_HIRBI|nr:holdfast anchoring protein HfaB [Hirschia baltica]ACT58352.1 holdfast attachment protein HfaB [Hirschia baltica ATCC 49814]